MLTKLRLILAYHLQAASISLNQLAAQPLASLMTIVVIAIALTLPTLFWVFTSNIEQLTVDWQKQGHISLYLKTSLTTAQQQHFLQQIQEQAGVGFAFLKSPDEGLAELQQQEGMHDILQYLDDNPLPPVIEVTPAVSLSSPAQVEALFTQLKNFPEIEQAKLDMRWVKKLHALLGFANRTTHALMLLLASAVVLIIGNTLRLAIHNRQEEIQILKLIGATDPFIARPFIYTGIWFALAGAILAILFCNIFMLSLGVALQQITAEYDMDYPFLGISLKQAYLLVFLGLLLGWLGAKVPLKKQLGTIEPYSS